MTITFSDEISLTDEDYLTWGAKKLERLEDIALELNRPELFDEINDQLKELWCGTGSVDSFRSSVLKLEEAFQWERDSKYGIPKSVMSKLQALIDGEVKKGMLEFDDNYRFAIVGEKVSEDSYEALMDDGCCGFFDDEVTISGKEYRYGFNFGH